MPDRQFAAQIRATIEAYRRKIVRLQEVADGKRDVRAVWRRGYRVRAHDVAGHYMHITSRKAAP